MVKISAAQSRAFVQRVGVPNTPASPSIKRLFDPDPIEDVFWTEEYGDFSPLPTAECPRSHGPRRILPAAEYVLNMAIINYISRIMVINRTVRSLGLVRIIDRAAPVPEAGTHDARGGQIPPRLAGDDGGRE